MAHPLLQPFLRWASRLRHPTLFKLTALVFAIDVMVPDLLPFADEILLGLATLLLANWKNRRTIVDAEPPKRP